MHATGCGLGRVRPAPALWLRARLKLPTDRREQGGKRKSGALEGPALPWYGPLNVVTSSARRRTQAGRLNCLQAAAVAHGPTDRRRLLLLLPLTSSLTRCRVSAPTIRGTRSIGLGIPIDWPLAFLPSSEGLNNGREFSSPLCARSGSERSNRTSATPRFGAVQSEAKTTQKQKAKSTKAP